MSELTTLTAYIIKAANGEKISNNEFIKAMNALASLSRKSTNNGLSMHDICYLTDLISKDFQKSAIIPKNRYETAMKLKKIMEDLHENGDLCDKIQ